MVTGFELGVIAWLLGGAAGIGMAVGCGENGTNGFTGLLAALITFLGIFIARMAIVLTIIIPMALGAANAPDEFFDEEFMEEEIGDEMALDEMGVDGEEAEEGDEELTAEEEEMQRALEESLADEEFESEEMPEAQIGLGGIIVAFFVFFGLPVPSFIRSQFNPSARPSG